MLSQLLGMFRAESTLAAHPSAQAVTAHDAFFVNLRHARVAALFRARMGAERSATPLPLGPLLAICCSVFVETTAFTQLVPYASFYVETLCSRTGRAA